MTITTKTETVTIERPVTQVICDLCTAELESFADGDGFDPERGIECEITLGSKTHILTDLCGPCAQYVADKVAELVTPISRVRTYGSKRSNGDEQTDDEATP